MHPIKLLAKATAKSLSINGAGGGGKAVFDSIDAAHALAGLSPMRSAFAYWRYCGDDAQYNKVKGNLYAKASRVARENGFKIKNTTIAGLVDASLHQLAMPMCKECDGVPFKKANNELTSCEKCHATGRKQLSIRQIGNISGINHKAITDNHKTIYRELNSLMATWEIEIISHVRSKMV